VSEGKTNDLHLNKKYYLLICINTVGLPWTFFSKESSTGGWA